jgi:hypothetical protein
MAAVRFVGGLGRALGLAGRATAEAAAASEDLPSVPLFRVAVAIETTGTRDAWRRRMAEALGEMTPQELGDYEAVIARYSA